ncbi:phage tail protein [Psychromicrobium lacuslunae]|uniref:Tape measure protein n=1 Tax=Psychromicrobium lacuslunae TaxID=1618207 RepID=A0A0D4C153_9MICC|nr:hypothetical protein [Psychromicrobium lacuslunae]AJT42422.1 hypothetical protein UM93_14620 [Psychromicrobium lacuslunae]
MASGVELARAFITLIPAMPGAQQSITNQLAPASAKAGQAGSSSLGGAFVSGLKKFAVPVAGALAAFSVGKFIKGSVAEFQSYQGAVNAFGRIAGGSVQQFSGLRAAIQLSGVDVNAAQSSMTIFSKNLGKAAQDGTKTAAMAKTLGTNFLDASGQVKPMSEILPALSDKFKAMPDGAQKTALAMQLFGRSGATLLPFLNKGSAGIAELTAQAGKMGLVLDETDQKIFGASKSSIRQFTMSMQGLKVAVGSTALPILTAFGNLGRAVLVPVIQLIARGFSAARAPVLAFAGHVQAMADRIGAITTGLIALFTKGDFTGGLRKALGLEEDSKIVGVLFSIRDAVGAVFSNIKGYFTGLNLGSVFSTLGQSFGPLIPQVVQLASSLSPLGLIFKSLAPLLPQIGSMFSQLGQTLATSLGAALKAVLPALGQVAQSLTTGLGQAFQAILPAISSLVPVIGQALGSLAGVIGSVVAAIAPMISQILPPLVGLFSQLIPVVANLVSSILPPLASIVTTIIGAIGPLISAILPPLIGLFQKIIPPVMQLVSSVLPPIATLFGVIVAAIAPLITQIASLLIPIINALMPVVTTVFGVIASIITSVMQIIQGVIQVVTGIISGNWSMVWTGIKNIFGGIWNTIVNVISGAIKIVGSVIGAGLNIARSIVSNVLGAIGNFFASTWRNVTNGVSGFIGGFLDFFRKMPGQILGFLSGLGSSLWNIGRDMIQGLLDGAGSLLRGIGDFFLRMIPGWIVEPFKAALGIHSPSTVFRDEVGAMIPAGLVEGIDGGVAQVDASLRSLVTVPKLPSLAHYRPAAPEYGGGLGAASLSERNSPLVHIENQYVQKDDTAADVANELEFKARAKAGGLVFA